MRPKYFRIINCQEKVTINYSNVKHNFFVGIEYLTAGFPEKMLKAIENTIRVNYKGEKITNLVEFYDESKVKKKKVKQEQDLES